MTHPPKKQKQKQQNKPKQKKRKKKQKIPNSRSAVRYTVYGVFLGGDCFSCFTSLYRRSGFKMKQSSHDWSVDFNL